MSGLDKRYQVFVSSTYEDLVPERQAVMQALLELDCIPAGMELFPAADDDQWTLIKSVIDDCDYYIVIIGGKYGSEAHTGISYTRMEYEYAVSTGKPVMAFLHKDISTLPGKRLELTDAQKKKLEEFRALAQKKMCKYWTTADELGSVVSRSLVQLIKTRPGIGWVRANLVADESAAQEILKLRRKVEELQALIPQETALRPAVRPVGYFIKLVEKYPRNAIQEAWLQVEAALNYGLLTHNLVVSNFSYNLSQLFAHGELTQTEQDEVIEFYRQAEQARGNPSFKPDPSAAVSAIQRMLDFSSRFIERCDGVWAIRRESLT